MHHERRLGAMPIEADGGEILARIVAGVGEDASG